MKGFRLASILIIITSSGCATIFSGSDEEVVFTSDPPNVKVFMNTRYLGETPIEVTVPRVGFAIANLNEFSFEKEGYTTQSFKLTTALNYITLFNTVSFTSYFTDAWTGAITRYSPDEYHIMMLKNDQDHHTSIPYPRSIIQSYILVNYEDLQRDILAGNGVHISNLADLMNIDEGKQSDFVAIMRSEIHYGMSAYEFLISLNRALKNSADFSQLSYLVKGDGGNNF